MLKIDLTPDIRSRFSYTYLHSAYIDKSTIDFVVTHAIDKWRELGMAAGCLENQFVKPLFIKFIEPNKIIVEG